ncbi:MAG: 50S ribosomal protein L10 [Desulfurococcales archaeon ex4484_58]|nr:MAG: 50S ribosomal protein L10 [Desulfurococcales archaeon ex4484_58]
MSVSVVPRAKRIPKWKIEEVEYLTKLFKTYPVFVIADLTGYPTNQLQRLRKKLDKKVVFRVSKNKLIMLAMKKAGIDTSKFEEILTGQNLLMFTNMNAFELADLIDKLRSKTYYKPGDIADQEIVIPAGDTGLPAGPILSTFGKLKIPTRVQGNTITVARDTVVAKPGDKISEELASLLQKLNMPLKEVRLHIKVAYDNGILIPGDQLALNIDEYRESLLKAHLEALSVGVEISWPEPEIIELSISKAARQALMLAIESAFITPETIEHVIRSAHMKAYLLATELAKQGVDLGVTIVKPVTTEEKKEEKPEKEKSEEEEGKEAVSEEELAEGLGALFG